MNRTPWQDIIKLFTGKKSALHCKGCGKIKHPKTFYRYNNKIGLRPYCIECTAKERRKPEEVIKRNTRLYKISTRFKNAKNEATYVGHSWTLTEAQYVAFASLPCHYCKRIFFTIGSGLDRKDNSKGYEFDNVLPCCKTCNSMKSNILTVEEMEAAMDAVKRYRAESSIYRAIVNGQLR